MELQLSLREPEAPVVRQVWARVTACSPADPKDVAYYRKYGYEGAVYNIAASYKQFPKGTRIKVPGYLEKSYPNTFWEVDSGGGSVIRRSAREGILHIDVKFATLASAKAWGSRWLLLDVVYPQ